MKLDFTGFWFGGKFLLNSTCQLLRSCSVNYYTTKLANVLPISRCHRLNNLLSVNEATCEVCWCYKIDMNVTSWERIKTPWCSFVFFFLRAEKVKNKII